MRATSPAKKGGTEVAEDWSLEEKHGYRLIAKNLLVYNTMVGVSHRQVVFKLLPMLGSSFL
jgi:hypothetical protein